MSNLLESILHLDQQVLIYLNNLGNEQWDPFWLAITNQFHWSPLFILVFILVIKSFGWKKGGFMILSMIVLVAFSDQFTNFIKNSFERLRPINDPEIKGYLRILLHPKSYSFMSGHATTSTFFSVYVFLLLKNKYKYIGFIFIFPAIFAYSRLYLGVHYPIDIFVGFLVGITFANLYFKLYKKLDKTSFA